jgi:hypothetical protein
MRDVNSYVSWNEASPTFTKKYKKPGSMNMGVNKRHPSRWLLKLQASPPDR